VPGTDGEGGPGSEAYDRWALQRTFDETHTLTLAAWFTGDAAFTEAAIARVRRWFCDPVTRMNPHLRFAQVRMGHSGNQGQPRGIIEFSDVYYFLDAVRLLARDDAPSQLSDTDLVSLRSWFSAYLAWLTDSPQGTAERSAANNHGTWYDVQVAAIADWLGDHRAVQATIVRASERIWHQFRPDGTQPEELARPIPLHYTTYNLCGWTHLERLIQRANGARQPLAGSERLDAAQRWLTDNTARLHPTEPEFDPHRTHIRTPTPYTPTHLTTTHTGIRPHAGLETP